MGCIFIMLLAFQILWAQPSPTDVLQVKYYYESVAFEKVISLGKKLLHSPEEKTPEELALVHRYMALSYYNLGQLDSSRAHFLSLLSIQSDTELDPVTVSPKIIDFFNSIKKDYVALQRADAMPGFTRYIFVKDLRPAAGWRSALLPGWGQFYKKQKIRGIILGGAFWSSLVATGIAALKEGQTHRDYLDSQTPDDINRNYDTYNKWYKTRRFLTVTTAILWGITLGDALWSDYPKPMVAFSEKGDIMLGMRIAFNLNNSSRKGAKSAKY